MILQLFCHMSQLWTTRNPICNEFHHFNWEKKRTIFIYFVYVYHVSGVQIFRHPSVDFHCAVTFQHRTHGPIKAIASCWWMPSQPCCAAWISGSRSIRPPAALCPNQRWAESGGLVHVIAHESRYSTKKNPHYRGVFRP